jgi:hypothetical protein
MTEQAKLVRPAVVIGWYRAELAPIVTDQAALSAFHNVRNERKLDC